MICKAVIRTGVLQLDGDNADSLVMEQQNKLKEELMVLDSVFQAGRRVMLFKSWDALWNKDNLEERLEELTDRIRKCELLTKVVKNVAAGMK